MFWILAIKIYESPACFVFKRCHADDKTKFTTQFFIHRQYLLFDLPPLEILVRLSFLGPPLSIKKNMF